jgi:hypothetical protein
MAITGTKVFTCSHGTTYTSVDQWIAAHGYAGTRELNLVSGNLVLNPDGQSVTATYVWEDQAQLDAWKANRTPFTREYTEVSKTDITTV